MAADEEDQVVGSGQSADDDGGAGSGTFEEEDGGGADIGTFEEEDGGGADIGIVRESQAHTSAMKRQAHMPGSHGRAHMSDVAAPRFHRHTCLPMRTSYLCLLGALARITTQA